MFLTRCPAWTILRCGNFYREIEQRFKGDYVVDLADLKQTALTVLPWLKAAKKPSLTHHGFRPN